MFENLNTWIFAIHLCWINVLYIFDSYSKCESIVILVRIRAVLFANLREIRDGKKERGRRKKKKKEKEISLLGEAPCRSDLCMWLTSYLASTLSRSCDSSTSGSFTWMAGVALAITRSSRWNSRSNGKRGSRRSFSPFFPSPYPNLVCVYIYIYDRRYPFRSLKNHRALLPWLWWIVHACVCVANFRRFRSIDRICPTFFRLYQ